MAMETEGVTWLYFVFQGIVLIENASTGVNFCKLTIVNLQSIQLCGYLLIKNNQGSFVITTQSSKLVVFVLSLELCMLLYFLFLAFSAKVYKGSSLF